MLTAEEQTSVPMSPGDSTMQAQADDGEKSTETMWVVFFHRQDDFPFSRRLLFLLSGLQNGTTISLGLFLWTKIWPRIQCFLLAEQALMQRTSIPAASGIPVGVN